MQSDAFVFFGATGDLAYKKIFPALYAMVQRGGFQHPIIGMARAGWNLDKLKERARDSVQQSGDFDDQTLRKTGCAAALCRWRLRGSRDLHQAEDRRSGLANSPIHYLAIPPSMFASVVQGLAEVRLRRQRPGHRREALRPGSRERAGARSHTCMKYSTNPRSFASITTLGKEAVQNLLYFRFANTFLEPIWNREYIRDIQITMAEDFGVQGRGAFYEEVGAIRDVVQNHLLQVVTLLAMDAPVGHDSKTMQAEKLRIFRAMRPLDPKEVVRGQFRGYRDEQGVAKDSQVETFAALRLHIDTWRWADVPFYIRAGKNLPITATEVRVTLKRPPLAIFDPSDKMPANYFRLRLSPEVVIGEGALAKLNGEDMRGEPVELIARHNTQAEKSPYERLLGDAVRGDTSLFTQDDCVEAAWRVVDPVLQGGLPVIEYEPGTWGPDAAGKIVDCGETWHDPQIEKSAPC